ncbi:non-ribosomal peptide synthetase, partial [Pseudoalteromonas luteoviolacea]
GGHSLLAAKLVSRVRERLNINISVKDVFFHQSIFELANISAQSESLAHHTIEPVNQDTDLVLSYGQQRLWLLDKIEQGSAHYNMPIALKLTGKLDKRALNDALSEILNRHEILRTQYRENEGVSYQVVCQAAPFELNIIDLSSEVIETHREQQLEERIRRQRTTPFDLANDLMLRAELVKLSEQKHYVLLTMHHIAADGWSLKLLTDELSQLYDAFVNGNSSPLVKLPIQYKDYAAWQQKSLAESELQTSLNYWQEKLLGIPMVHQLPTDHARPAVPDMNGRVLKTSIDKGLSNSLNALAKEQNVTLFMLLHAAFTCLLNKYSGESDIVLGSPIANRDMQEVESLVGFFINTLVLRSQVERSDTFVQHLQKSKDCLLEAYEHQHVPFEMLVQSLDIARSTSHSPIFQIMIVMQNYQQATLDLTDLTLSVVESSEQQAKFDLTLFITETDNNIELNWEYAQALFEPETVARLSSHFINLLTSIVAQQNTAIADLKVLSEQDKQALIYDWNDTVAPYPKGACMHQLFEQQAQKTPDNVAVVFEGNSITYRELEARANQIAHYLKAQVCESQQFIGVCLERSINMVAGLLGVLKSGFAYIPLDPEYPSNRIGKILEKSETKFVLTDDSSLDKHDFENPLNVEQAYCSNMPSTPLSLVLNAKDTAYVIFTSGSTGEPKGVVISHESAVNLLTLVNRRFEINEHDTVLCITSIGFDLSVYDIFGSIATGAKLVVSKADDALEPRRLIKLLQENQVTYWDSVPSTLKMLIDYLDTVASDVVSPHLRLAFLSGDWIPTSLPDQVNNYFPKLQVISLGGATEGTVWSNYYPITQPMSHRKSVPYGKPLDNNRFYVLDEHLNPVPPGCVGDLFIGGVGVAQGYLNDEMKTSAAFMPDPFYEHERANMYKTGDRGRIMLEAGGKLGNMEFLGRIDNQVKIRGFRVELGEVESCLQSHDAIKLALAVVIPESMQIYAYVISEENKQVDTQELLSLCSISLADYMVPAGVMQIEKLPLSNNGKVDRKALPKPVLVDSKNNIVIHPRTDTEKQLSEIWSNLLGIAQVSVQASFFDIGGQSLLATRLASQILVEFGVEVAIRSLFQNDTIEKQAKLIEQVLDSTDLLDRLDELSEEELDAQLKLLEELGEV